MIILIDNYDSFTYNLVHYFGEIGNNVVLFKNDEKKVSELISLNPTGIVISPGPCNPDKAGVSLDITLKAADKKIPTFGATYRSDHFDIIKFDCFRIMYI